MITTEAVITAVREEARTLRRLQLTVSSPRFAFLPGQWIDLVREPDGSVGGYSMTNAPGELGEGVIELGVRRSKHPVTRWLHDEAKVGDTVTVRGGQGSCVYAPAPGDEVVFVAGGVGITPLLSMARAARRSPHPLRAVLLYCVRSPEDVAFRTELTALAADDRLRVVIRASDDLVTTEDALRLGGLTASYYLCGPPGMIDTLASGLAAAGLPEDQIRYERW
ncbi:MAG: ferredoxin-NADP reductase [Myxococcota bacterium]|jgi:ferredoxin-NADP reductase